MSVKKITREDMFSFVKSLNIENVKKETDILSKLKTSTYEINSL